MNQQRELGLLATDQSEPSIGNKTAEELVGDILCSDPHEDDAMLANVFIKKDAEPSMGELRLRDALKDQDSTLIGCSEEDKF